MDQLWHFCAMIDLLSNSIGNLDSLNGQRRHHMFLRILIFLLFTIFNQIVNILFFLSFPVSSNKSRQGQTTDL